MAFPSTFVNIQNEVISRVRLDAVSDLSRTKDWINQIYSEVCIETEATQDYSTMALTANTSVYTLDAQIVRIKQMYVTPSGQGQSRPLVPTSLEEILEWSASSGATASNQGSVTHYAQFGYQTIKFYPTPTAADTVTIYYLKQPTALSADSDVPVIQEPYSSICLVNGASYKAALFLKDPDAELYRRDYEDSIHRFRGHLRRKQGSMSRQFRLTRSNSVVPNDPSTDLRGQ